MKGRLLIGVVSCALILAVAGMAAAAGVTANADVKSKDLNPQGSAWLGVQLQDLTKEVAKSMDLKIHRGALLAQVQDGSPADQAGLKSGDVITKFNDKSIHSASDLTEQVRREEPGHEVPITIVRNGGEMKLTVRLGDISERNQNRYGEAGDTYREENMGTENRYENPPSDQSGNYGTPAEPESGNQYNTPQYNTPQYNTPLYNRNDQGETEPGENPSWGGGGYQQQEFPQQGYQQPRNEQMPMGNQQTGNFRTRAPKAFLGVELQALTDQLGEFFGVQDGKGALIARVVEDSPAAQAGLKAGDVITKIDDQEIGNPMAVTQLVHNDNPGDTINITYMSDQGHSANTVTVQLARPEAGQNAWMMDRDMNMGPMHGMQNMQGMQDMQNMQDMRMHHRMNRTYGSGAPGFEDQEQMHQQFQEMREQMEQLRQQMENLREQMQNERK